MIKVTREQLLMSEKGLNILANAKVPLGVAYRIKKIIQQVTTELQDTEKIRHEIIEKYGKRDENGELIIDKSRNTIEIENEKRNAFGQEITVLFNEVCEFIGEPIDISLLENISMSSQEISSIEAFLKLE